MKHRITIAAAVLACTACSADPVTAPRDLPPQLSVGALATGYGFYAQPGNTSAVAITDGASKICVKTGFRFRRWALPLTPGILANVQAVLAEGGSAEVEVNTKVRYVGSGRLNARETIDVLANGGSIGSASAKGSATDPGYQNGGDRETIEEIPGDSGELHTWGPARSEPDRERDRGLANLRADLRRFGQMDVLHADPSANTVAECTASARRRGRVARRAASFRSETIKGLSYATRSATPAVNRAPWPVSAIAAQCRRLARDEPQRVLTGLHIPALNQYVVAELDGASPTVSVPHRGSPRADA